MAARTGTVSRSARGTRPRLLPSGTGEFFRRRLIETLALTVLALGLAVFAACLTFDPADPSLNQAIDGPVTNLFGLPGAYASEFLLQTLGLAAFAAPVMVGGWGWRLLRRHRLPRWWLRLAILPFVLLVFATALAALPTPESWPLSNGLGGFAGALLLGEVSLVTGVASRIIAAGALGIGLIGFLYALGLSRRDWSMGGRAAAWLTGHAGRGLNIVLRRPLYRAPAAPKTPRRTRRTGSRVEPRLRPSTDRRSEEEDEVEAFAPHGGRPKRRLKAGFIAPKSARTAPGKRGKQAAQRHLDFGPGSGYELPSLSFLELPPITAQEADLNRDALEKNARLLESVLEDFGVRGEIVKVRPGPVVTSYELAPAPGTKTSRVVGLADDIARSMSAVSVRVAVVPGSNVIGIELPNRKRETVYLRELLASRVYERAGGKLPLILGKDIGGGPIIVDLWRMPHLLVAGTTGSGKSVGLNSMILSLLYRLSPDQCKFIMIDPKMLELSVYDGIPHLLSPVVTEPKKAVVALKWTVREMEERYRAMSRLGVRNIDGYNLRIEEALKTGEVLTRRVQTGFDPDTGQPLHEEQPFDLEPLPYVVVVVDEMADLMMVAGKDVEMAVQRLAQMARAAGIHLIMATQRPSVDVITGTIKANFPTRISFHVTSKIDSRTILGEIGAEQLLGQGDMLYMAHGGRISRVHGPLVTDQEVEDVVSFLKRQGQPSYIDAVTEDDEPDFDALAGGREGGDELYDRAVAVVFQHRKASTSFIQRHLQIGYNRAARIVERMEAEGVVSQANHVGKREVLMPGGEG